MNNRGFTLIELLMVVVIMAAISGIVVVSYQNIYNKTGDKYYDVLEKNITLAGSEFFREHKDLLKDNASVSINRLIEEDYLNTIYDKDGNTCNGEVFIKKENGNYQYLVCLRCNNYQGANCSK